VNKISKQPIYQF